MPHPERSLPDWKRAVMYGIAALSFTLGHALAEPGRVYALAGVREAASALHLHDDGTYAFHFSAGSLDEIDAGTWRASGDRIVLESTPLPGRPAVELVRQARRPGDGVTVVIETSGAQDAIGRPVDVIVQTAGGPIRLRQAERNRYEGEVSAAPARIELKTFNMAGQSPTHAVAVTDRSANEFVVRVDTTAFGRIRFQALEITVQGDMLYLPLTRDYTLPYKFTGRSH